MNIGQAIRTIRKERTPYVNQRDMAKSIGITQAYLSKIESGKTPNINVLQDIAKYFDMPLAIMFWISFEESDVQESKRVAFKIIKPSIDALIKRFIN